VRRRRATSRKPTKTQEAIKAKRRATSKAAPNRRLRPSALSKDTDAAQAVIAIENTRLLNELRESLQQQTATAEVLSAISSTPGKLTPVFETMLVNAARLCEAKFGNLLLYEGGRLRTVATHNVPPAYAESRRRRGPFHPPPGGQLDEVIRTKGTVQVADLAAAQGYAERHRVSVEAVELGGVRTGGERAR
jgi:hypothetical protein